MYIYVIKYKPSFPASEDYHIYGTAFKTRKEALNVVKTNPYLKDAIVGSLYLTGM